MCEPMEASSKSEAAVRTAVRTAIGSRAAFDLRGVTTSLTVLRLRTLDMNMVERQLRAKVAQQPQFFEGAPVAVDLGALNGDAHRVPLPSLVHMLRACRVVPVGIFGIPDELKAHAASAGFGLLTPGASRGREAADESEQDGGGEQRAVEPPPARTPAPAIGLASQL